MQHKQFIDKFSDDCHDKAMPETPLPQPEGAQPESPLEVFTAMVDARKGPDADKPEKITLFLDNLRIFTKFTGTDGNRLVDIPSVAQDLREMGQHNPIWQAAFQRVMLADRAADSPKGNPDTVLGEIDVIYALNMHEHNPKAKEFYAGLIEKHKRQSVHKPATDNTPPLHDSPVTKKTKNEADELSIVEKDISPTPPLPEDEILPPEDLREFMDRDPFREVPWEDNPVDALERMTVWLTKEKEKHPHTSYTENVFPTLTPEQRSRTKTIRFHLERALSKVEFLLDEAKFYENQRVQGKPAAIPIQQQERDIQSAEELFDTFMHMLPKESQERDKASLVKALHTPLTDDERGLLASQISRIPIDRPVQKLPDAVAYDIPDDLQTKIPGEPFKKIEVGVTAHVLLFDLPDDITTFGFTDTGTDAHKAALKVSRRNDGIEQEEVAILRMLRERHQRMFPGSPNPFPEAKLGTYREAPAIMMEYMDPRASFGALSMTEEVLLQTLVGAFEATATVHSYGWNAHDRKNTDIHYIHDQNRTVILDWNAVNGASKKVDALYPVKSDFLTIFNSFFHEGRTAEGVYRQIPQETLRELTRIADMVQEAPEGTFTGAQIRTMIQRINDPYSLNHLKPIHTPVEIDKRS